MSKAWVGNSSNVPIELSNPDNDNSELFINIKKSMLSDITTVSKVSDSSGEDNYRYKLEIKNNVSVNLVYGLMSSRYEIDNSFTNYWSYNAYQIWIGTGSFNIIFYGNLQSGYFIEIRDSVLTYDSNRNIFTITNFISESSIPNYFTLFYV